MTRRYPDSWGWWRVVMSPLGPSRTTRFVLCGHMLFLHPRGDGCYASTRRLAEVTGLNKDTVAEHREIALRHGWLMRAPAAERIHACEVWTTLPDDVFAQVAGASGRSAYSQVAVDIRSQPASLSGSFPETVRFQPADCPAPPDISLRDLNISKSHSDLGDMSDAPVDISRATYTTALGAGNESAVIERRRKDLLRWLVTDLRETREIDDLTALLSRIPGELRYEGHEDLVQRYVEDVRNASTGRGASVLQPLAGHSPEAREDGG
jgi:hypothetical protein